MKSGTVDRSMKISSEASVRKTSVDLKPEESQPDLEMLKIATNQKMSAW